MNVAEKAFLDFLDGSTPDFETTLSGRTRPLSSIDMADIYIHAALLSTFMGFIKEQFWLQKKQDATKPKPMEFGEFMAPFFLDELASVLFLKEFLIVSGPKNIQKILHAAESAECQVLDQLSQRSNVDKKEFAVRSLQEMNKHFLQEESRQDGRLQSLGHKGPELYRTFDGIDRILDLKYRLEKNATVDYHCKERLYQGAGIGVQSGYSSILLAMHALQLEAGSRIIDLGSGFGRVGLVCSLLRPDVEFIGYEYVAHRVQISNHASQTLGLEKSLLFVIQDLSLETFRIPDADVYYLYDPFTQETYQHVLKQIIEVSQRKTIRVVTKGNARDWLMDLAREHSWPAPLLIDEGNLCVFSLERSGR